MKTPYQLERHMKGVANHWRIRILLLVGRKKNLRLEDIAEALDANMKTISEHTKRLAHAGLLQKKYIGNSVSHSLSPYGNTILRFIKSF